MVVIQYDTMLCKYDLKLHNYDPKFKTLFNMLKNQIQNGITGNKTKNKTKYEKKWIGHFDLKSKRKTKCCKNKDKK